MTGTPPKKQKDNEHVSVGRVMPTNANANLENQQHRSLHQASNLPDSSLYKSDSRA